MKRSVHTDRMSEMVQNELNKIAKGLPSINSPKIRKSPLLTKDQIQMILHLKEQQQKANNS